MSARADVAVLPVRLCTMCPEASRSCGTNDEQIPWGSRKGRWGVVGYEVTELCALGGELANERQLLEKGIHLSLANPMETGYI